MEETKICKKCVIEKPLSDFRIIKGNKGNSCTYSYCRSCENCASKEYRFFNKEKIGNKKREKYLLNEEYREKEKQHKRDTWRVNYDKDPAFYLKKSKDYRILHPEKISSHNKNYRRKNIEKIKIRGAIYRSSNIEKSIERSRIRVALLPDNYIASIYKIPTFILKENYKEFIEIKRQMILIKREITNQKPN